VKHCTDTRLGGWVQTLLEAADAGFPFEATARLLAHPLGPGLDGETWTRAQAKRPHGPQAWRALGAPETLFSLPPGAKRWAFVDALEHVLTSLDLRRGTLPWPRELLAYHALLDGLRHLPGPEEQVDLSSFAAPEGHLQVF